MSLSFPSCQKSLKYPKFPKLLMFPKNPSYPPFQNYLTKSL
jgi:hypothetical protein